MKTTFFRGREIKCQQLKDISKQEAIEAYSGFLLLLDTQGMVGFHLFGQVFPRASIVERNASTFPFL